MAAPDTTKFQVNYKLADVTLINLYATDIKDLETGLTDLSMVASLIKSTSADFAGGNATATAVQNIQSQFNTMPVSTQPAAVTNTGQDVASVTKMCRHGAMVYREGVGQKGPWKAYMCAAPKGAPDKCDAIWIR